MVNVNGVFFYLVILFLAEIIYCYTINNRVISQNNESLFIAGINDINVIYKFNKNI